MELVLDPDSHLDDGVLPASLPARDLVTILGNLIDNAVDAVGDAAARGDADAALVTVTVAVDEAADELLLAVADTGPGVPPGCAEDAFRRGWTTKDGPAHGRGLGLALVRQAVRRHGGTIEVTAPPGGGARFTVRLPLTPAAAPDRAAAEPVA